MSDCHDEPPSNCCCGSVIPSSITAGRSGVPLKRPDRLRRRAVRLASAAAGTLAVLSDALILAAYAGFVAALAPAVWYGDKRWLILYLAACAAVLVLGTAQTVWRWWRR